MPEVSPKTEVESAPTLTEGVPQMAENPTLEAPPYDEPETPYVLPKPETEAGLTQPTIVRIPPDAIFDHIPTFPQGGITLVKLYDELSQQRIKNTEQTLGRRFVWNFDADSYTLLLGLSVEAYNT